jgi:hypothetical protein
MMHAQKMDSRHPTVSSTVGGYLTLTKINKFRQWKKKRRELPTPLLLFADSTHTATTTTFPMKTGGGGALTMTLTHVYTGIFKEQILKTKKE